MKKTNITKIILYLMLLIISVNLVSGAIGSLIGSTGDLAATLSSQLPDPVEPGNFVEVRFNIQNEGATENDVTFELLPSYPLSLLPGDNGVRKIGTMLGRQMGEDAVLLYYKLKVNPEATAGNSTLKLRYMTKPRVYKQFKDFIVRIREPQAFLTIDAVKTEPEELLPGRIGYVKIGLTNYARFGMRNIWLTLDTINMPFSGFESSNEKFISRVEPGETIYETFKIIVDGDATSKVYNVPIALSYEDDIGTEYSRDVEIGLIVNERPKYLINIEELIVLYEGQSGEVIFSISNVGTADIKFAILELLPSSNDEYNIISAEKVYVGNLESDDFETINYKIHVDGVTKKEVPFNLVLKYKDNFNNQYEDVHQLPFKIYSKREAGKLGLADVPGIGSYLFSSMIAMLIIVFTTFMILDWMTNKMARYKRILWLIVILTPGIGALAYYFFGRKKSEI